MYRNKDAVFDLQKMHIAHTKNSLRYKYLGIHKQSLSLSPKTFPPEPRVRVIGRKQTYTERKRYIVMQNNIV